MSNSIYIAALEQLADNANRTSTDDMHDYNYRANVLYDTAQAIVDALEHGDIDLAEYDTVDDLAEAVHDLLWMDDNVTGNGSGSYTFSTYKAECYLSHNWDLLQEARGEFGDDSDVLSKGAEHWDVMIRCHLLRWAIDEALEALGIDEDILGGNFAEEA